MNTKFLFVSLLLTLLITACSLSGEQEASLNKSVIEYIEARNNNRVSMRVRLTHPKVVRYYKNKGDEIFKERFRPENNNEYWRDPTIRTVEKSGKVIHVKYEVTTLHEYELEIVEDRRDLYAISSDDGQHWKFMDSDEYNNDEILPKDKKLIK